MPNAEAKGSHIPLYLLIKDRGLGSSIFRGGSASPLGDVMMRGAVRGEAVDMAGCGDEPRPVVGVLPPERR